MEARSAGAGTAETTELSRVRFGDIDEMLEWELAQGWDVRNMQLSSGANEIQYDHFDFPEFRVAHFAVKQSMHYRFSLPPGTVMLNICRRKQPLLWCGTQLPPTLMGITRAGIEHDVVERTDWDCYEFILSEDLLRSTGIFPDELLDDSEQFEHARLPLAEPVTGHFLQQLDACFTRGRCARGSEGEPVQKTELFDTIVGGLITVVDAGLRTRGTQSPRPALRYDVVSRARDYVAAYLASQFSVEDMARDLGVSYRLLNYAFRDAFGMSPYRYVLVERLNAARRELLSSGTSVTETLFKWGFSHPGRFADQYRRQFGELPSETRRTTSSC